MIYKKIIIVFLLILCVFCFSSFSSVHASTENTNVTSSSTEHMKADIDYLKQLLKKNNINNMDDLVSFFGANSAHDICYFCILDVGHFRNSNQSVRFYSNFNGISFGVDNYSYYGVQQNSFTLHHNYSLWYSISGSNTLNKESASSGATFTAPICWYGFKTANLFIENSSQNVENTLTQDNSKQDDINLGSHNNEMDTASNTIKNSNLYSKFDNLTNELNDAFTYNDDEVSTIPISFNNYDYVLRSDTISSFFKNNNLGFVVLLWQSILWFSLFYTMFLFIRKLYKAFAGGNPVDQVSSTLSNEDNKIVGGF